MGRKNVTGPNASGAESVRNGCGSDTGGSPASQGKQQQEHQTGQSPKKQKSGTDDLDIEKELLEIFEKAKASGMTEQEFKDLDVFRRLSFDVSYTKSFLLFLQYFLAFILILYILLAAICLFNFPIHSNTLLRGWFYISGGDPEFEKCAVEMPDLIHDLFRPPVECNFCKNVTKIDTVYNITQQEFEELYAYTGVPVVVGDGTGNWTAPQHFSFEFFKGLYSPGSQALENQMRKCQFFPYRTEFRDLGEVLGMSSARANMEDGSKPWYIGWSNCDFKAGNVLRQHYRRPYFLPALSESSKTDWMFMGSPGYGAHMHIDNVDKPSWQAQITGTKRWTLEPPPECYFTCPESLEVTVHPGQIIVIDTNIWYHSTLNIGNDISITIGSEYD